MTNLDFGKRPRDKRQAAGCACLPSASCIRTLKSNSINSNNSNNNTKTNKGNKSNKSNTRIVITAIIVILKTCSQLES